VIAFSEIRARAAVRKGGEAALDALMPQIRTAAELAAIPDDRWLSMFSRCVFQAGFSWSVVEKKWQGFEEAFHGFDPAWNRAVDGERFDALLSDRRIIRNGAKVRSVQLNAALLMDLAPVHGSAGACFAHWPASDFSGLLEMLKTRGDRLGGGAGAIALRFMGRDGWVLSPDVVRALTAAGVLDGPIGSKKASRAVQAAFDAWSAESGAPFAHISRTLALSVD
jgi:3-methyladenine DNA glycosylase Tag